MRVFEGSVSWVRMQRVVRFRDHQNTPRPPMAARAHTEPGTRATDTVPAFSGLRLRFHRSGGNRSRGPSLEVLWPASPCELANLSWFTPMHNRGAVPPSPRRGHFVAPRAGFVLESLPNRDRRRTGPCPSSVGGIMEGNFRQRTASAGPCDGGVKPSIGRMDLQAPGAAKTRALCCMRVMTDGGCTLGESRGERPESRACAREVTGHLSRGAEFTL